ncbi:hypothetical protein [Novipirellula artificiosorum]|uniref:Tetratricopeptide repeat protein n=1 Tax=Novipirellula artificiosorum TaxID=2528016 RepID=A0A5C6DVM8_9BACT|nr:hypothetical protein [Novipirellula artificiosorum]TWU40760.1 hypothetical protein Poly41_15950 [Novipirellula artificiosorum]
MKKSLLIAASVAVCSLSLTLAATSTSAQSAVLAEMYGRGVHAYYAGRYQDANEYLSMAINNGSKDPRAYYFRGLVANAEGRQYEADNDWRQGAQLEVATGTSAEVGRSLARFQGPDRLKLEQFRQKARLEALALAAARSQQRYGEIDAASAAATPQVAPKTAPPKAITPPPIPSEIENPFADDSDTASGDAKLESNDAFADAMEAEPDAGAPVASGDASAASGSDTGAAADDPFNTDSADPFAGGGDDPFGGL